MKTAHTEPFPVRVYNRILEMMNFGLDTNMQYISSGEQQYLRQSDVCRWGKRGFLACYINNV